MTKQEFTHVDNQVMCFFPQSVMKDKWMNAGYEDDELKPYLEPSPDLNDPARIRKWVKYSI